MKVKVLRASYFPELRDAAYAAYREKQKRELKQLEDAYLIKEADAKTYGRHSPSNGREFEYWYKQLQQMNKDSESAFNEYIKAYDRYKDEQYCLTCECKFFVNRYEEEHYKPTDEDYEEVEVESADDVAKRRVIVSHASDPAPIGEPLAEAQAEADAQNAFVEVLPN